MSVTTQEQQLNGEDSIHETKCVVPNRTYVEPPDGKYGWVIVIACFLGQTLTMTNLLVPGMFFVHIKDEFDVSYANLNILFSLRIGIYFLMSPLASIFGNRYGSRLMISTGGILQAAATTLSSLAPSIVFIHIFLGMLAGIGSAFTYSPLSVEIAKHFKERRSLALSISQTGRSVGNIIGPIFLQYLIDGYSWRGALVIVGAINLHLLVCGALMRPINIKPDDKKEENRRRKLLDIELFKSKMFTLYELTEVLVQPVHNFFLFYLVAYATTEQGYSEYQAVTLMSVSAFVGLVARPIIGVVRLFFKTDCFAFLTVIVGVMASNYAIYPFLTSYWTSLILVGIYGFCKSGLIMAGNLTDNQRKWIIKHYFSKRENDHSLLSIDGLSIIVEPNKLMSAFGLRGIMLTPFNILLPPLAGWLSDTYGTLRATFWLSFGFLFLSTLLLLVYYLLFAKKLTKTEITTEEGERN